MHAACGAVGFVLSFSQAGIVKNFHLNVRIKEGCASVVVMADILPSR